jgi:D-alanyl-lipoteichoic acid acyltransferase DltB (MBOAT superfamily)
LNIRIGFNLFLWGLLKKVVFADNLGVFADRVFAEPSHYSSLAVLLGVYAFAFQIYFDFSAYSHMAMGSARLLGVRFTKNFDLPYLATDIADFWRRWHITLSTWLRDYLYIPLGGSRKGELRTYVNLILTMLIGGAWHGANWTFVVWGAFHGFLLAITRFVKEHFAWVRPAGFGAVTRAAAMALTFQLVCAGWILFRAPTLEDAGRVLGRIFGGHGLALTPEFIVLAVVLVMAMAGHALAGRLRRSSDLILAHATPALDIAYASSILLALLLFGHSGIAKFIYFEF